MMKKIILLGSTGSVGKNALKVVRHLGPSRCQVLGLAAHSNIEVLKKQIDEFKPKVVAVYNERQAQALQKERPHLEVLCHEKGLIELASHPESNLVFNSIVGTSGLLPMMAAIEAKKDIALANKEVLVSAGEIIMNSIKKNGSKIIPVDSEHSALFQCLQGQPIESVSRLILTASGGPFLHHALEKLKKVTLEEALKHPTWTMGKKITVDSSTLMNKGFEVIEAHWLFDVPIDSIEVVIHPQSIIHSLVEFIDNTLLAQLGEPEMLTPIQYALTYPNKLPGLLKPFNFAKYTQLEFKKPDFKRFHCLKIAYDSLKLGGSYSCFLNAINETLVKRFLEKRISWYDISQKMQRLMDKHCSIQPQSIHDILKIDQQARQEALLA